MLIIFGGLPGTGKTTIARALTARLGAVHLRIDTIEQAIRASGAITGPMEDVGYRAAYALAEDNLRIGLIVVADSVNPLPVTRDAWADVAKRAGVKAVEVELICSDQDEHKRRVHLRETDVPGLKLPTWREIRSRHYEPWDRPHLVIDTAHHTAEQAVGVIKEALLQS